MNIETKKNCRACDVLLTPGNTYQSQSSYICKDCTKIVVKQWREKNREKYLKQHRENMNQYKRIQRNVGQLMLAIETPPPVRAVAA